MARESYEPALARLLAHEGGYSNHPADAGGPTKYGITIADYRRYVMPGATAADVRAMHIDEAKAIYRARYWNAMRCDELPAGLDYALFDYGVNSGVARATEVLRQLLGLTRNEGVSDATIAAARRRDAADLVTQLCDERLAFLRRLNTWPVFGAGWSRRVAEVRSTALEMAARDDAVRNTAQRNAAARPVARAGLAGVVAALAAALGGAGLDRIFDKETIMTTFVPIFAALLAGYIAAVLTWPRLRRALVGIDSEIEALRARARALEAKLRG